MMISQSTVLNNLYKVAINPATAITIETLAKGTMRPIITMMDKSVDIDTRKYSATLEFLYQMNCLALHLLVAERGKKIGFNVAKKLLEGVKDSGFDKFKNFEEAIHASNLPLMVKGSIMVGSILASVLALTVVAPKLSHTIIPPILKKLGLKTKDEMHESHPTLEAKKLNGKSQSFNGLPKNMDIFQLQKYQQNK